MSAYVSGSPNIYDNLPYSPSASINIPNHTVRTSYLNEFDRELYENAIRIEEKNSPYSPEQCHKLETEIDSLLRILKEKQSEISDLKAELSLYNNEKNLNYQQMQGLEKKVLQIVASNDQLNSLVSKNSAETNYWKNKYIEISNNNLENSDIFALKQRNEELMIENIRLNDKYEEKISLLNNLDDLMMRSESLVKENQRLNMILKEQAFENDVWRTKTLEAEKRVALKEANFVDFEENLKENINKIDILNSRNENLAKENSEILIAREKLIKEKEEFINNEEKFKKNKENLENKIDILLQENLKLNKLIDNLSIDNKKFEIDKNLLFKLNQSNKLLEDYSKKLEINEKRIKELQEKNLENEQNKKLIDDLQNKLAIMIEENGKLNTIIEEKLKDLTIFEDLQVKIEELIVQNNSLQNQNEYWKTRFFNKNIT